MARLYSTKISQWLFFCCCCFPCVCLSIKFLLMEGFLFKYLILLASFLLSKKKKRICEWRVNRHQGHAIFEKFLLQHTHTPKSRQEIKIIHATIFSKLDYLRLVTMKSLVSDAFVSKRKKKALEKRRGYKKKKTFILRTSIHFFAI